MTAPDRDLAGLAQDLAYLGFYAPQALAIVDGELDRVLAAPPALRMPGLPVDTQSPGYLKLVEDQADAWELK